MRTAHYLVVVRCGWAPDEVPGPAHLARQVVMESPAPGILRRAFVRVRPSRAARIGNEGSAGTKGA
jgi:hypothetical protein